jgi:excisionase family DNA binding protein
MAERARPPSSSYTQRLARVGPCGVYSPGSMTGRLEGADVAQAKGAEYLKTAEVADILHVSPKTVTRWAKDGKLPHSRTLGGHRRFPAQSIKKIADGLIQVDQGTE